MNYDVCLSFAGEDREYVGAVAGALRRRAVRVFYDEYERAALWGKDLYSHLDYVYRSAARYCVVFISENYSRKLWTSHERRSAQARAFSEATEYVLPARFDDTDIPGLPPTIGYVDLRAMSPSELADLICEKLELSAIELSGPEGNGGSYAFKWIEPLEFASTDAADRISTFQNIPVTSNVEGLEGLVGASVRALEDSARHDDRGVYWTFHQDRYFDRIYSTASVLTGLVQLGADHDAYLLRRGIEYLDSTSVTSIDDRAASIFRLITGRLTEDQVLAFIDVIAQHQVRDADSNIYGSFLLPQGPISSLGKKENWSAAPLHSDGAAFHACHLADVLLHIPQPYVSARSRAEPILAQIRGFLARDLAAHDGWLVDIEGARTTRTLYGFAVCPYLSVPLPGKWREIAGACLDLISSKRSSLIARCFGIMNCWYVYSTTRDEEFRVVASEFARRELESFPARTELLQLDAPDVSAVQRAIVYAVQLIDGRLGRFVAAAAKTAVTEASRRLEANG